MKDLKNSNKRWLHRLNLVTTLSEWVEANLRTENVVWESQDKDKKKDETGSIHESLSIRSCPPYDWAYVFS